MNATCERPVETVTRSRKSPAAPRGPLSWQWDRCHNGLKIEDCDRNTEDYRLTELPVDFGRGFELVKTGSDFGKTYHVHLDRELGNSCTCPGGIYRGTCKHLTAVTTLVELGRL